MRASDARTTFDATARELEEPLVRYATRILGDRDRARDVVQDAFLRLHQETQAGSDVVDQPRRWLYTVCRNRALDILRQQKRLRSLEDHADTREAVADSSFDRRAAGEVIEMFDRLPEKQRQVLEMRFAEDKSYRSIGKATGISVGHVGYLIHDGIRVLRRHLGVATVLVLLGGSAWMLLRSSSSQETTVGPDDTTALPAAERPVAAPVMSAAPIATSRLPAPMASAAATAEPAASAGPSATVPIFPLIPPAVPVPAAKPRLDHSEGREHRDTE